MRRIVVLGLASLVLVACNQTAQQPPADTQSVASAVAQPEAPAAVPAVNPDFPTGFEPPFGYKIRSRKTEESPEGPVRKLVIEFKQGDVATVDKQIEELLTAKGYRRYKSFQQGEGLVGDYGNQGRRVTVTTNPANGQLALAADSLGTVYFVWKE
ncbi:hypothetical protein [Lysobacter solisilvae (ex Woo and Kim 2020)]|uniref:Uncharacterized protein n=1 Tax=Agrilutibacter terrestris TaxID=2865112 RepID=A0A7H0FZG4_9GAMM|nr:hypothetical protein [Lysobacter terrestris]QNP41430.1 hypothetical protein H8B22_04185 [Lysobacter terrestris]